MKGIALLATSALFGIAAGTARNELGYWLFWLICWAIMGSALCEIFLGS